MDDWEDGEIIELTVREGEVPYIAVDGDAPPLVLDIDRLSERGWDIAEI